MVRAMILSRSTSRRNVHVGQIWSNLPLWSESPNCQPSAPVIQPGLLSGPGFGDWCLIPKQKFNLRPCFSLYERGGSSILFSDLFNRQGMGAAQRQFKIIASLTLWLKLALGTFSLGRDFVPLRQSPSQIPCSSQWGISVTPSLGIYR